MIMFKVFAALVAAVIAVCGLTSYPSLLGTIAATCTTLAFLPQVIHTIKTKDTEAISLTMYVMFVFGVLCWLIYGILSKDMPLMMGNGLTLILSSVVLYLKIRSTAAINSVKDANPVGHL